MMRRRQTLLAPRTDDSNAPNWTHDTHHTLAVDTLGEQAFHGTKPSHGSFSLFRKSIVSRTSGDRPTTSNGPSRQRPSMDSFSRPRTATSASQSRKTFRYRDEAAASSFTMLPRPEPIDNIGVALGSPTQLYSHQQTSSPRSHMRRAQTDRGPVPNLDAPGTHPLWAEPEQRRTRSIKWKSIGGLFGKKRASSRGAALKDTSDASVPDLPRKPLYDNTAPSSPPKPRLSSHFKRPKRSDTVASSSSRSGTPTYVPDSWPQRNKQDMEILPAPNSANHLYMPKTSHLNIDIPTPGLERYSIMFSSQLKDVLLKPEDRQSIIARRKGTDKRLTLLYPTENKPRGRSPRRQNTSSSIQSRPSNRSESKSRRQPTFSLFPSTASPPTSHDQDFRPLFSPAVPSTPYSAASPTSLHRRSNTAPPSLSPHDFSVEPPSRAPPPPPLSPSHHHGIYESNSTESDAASTCSSISTSSTYLSASASIVDYTEDYRFSGSIHFQHPAFPPRQQSLSRKLHGPSPVLPLSSEEIKATLLAVPTTSPRPADGQSSPSRQHGYDAATSPLIGVARSISVVPLPPFNMRVLRPSICSIDGTRSVSADAALGLTRRGLGLDALLDADRAGHSLANDASGPRLTPRSPDDGELRTGRSRCGTPTVVTVESAEGARNSCWGCVEGAEPGFVAA